MMSSTPYSHSIYVSDAVSVSVVVTPPNPDESYPPSHDIHALYPLHSNVLISTSSNSSSRYILNLCTTI